MKFKAFGKAAAVVAATLTVTAACFFGGCSVQQPRDGINGKDLNIYDIWQETKEQTGNPDLSFDQFLKEYLSFDSSTLEKATSTQAAINRSLLTSVSIRTTFTEYTNTAGSLTAVTSTNRYLGSGVILGIDKERGDMTVITNCHVVYSAKARYASPNGTVTADGFTNEIEMWLYGGEYEERNVITGAKLIAASKSYDLAIIKVENSDLVKNSVARAAEWCDDEELYLGEQVFAIGNPSGKKLSVSSGLISNDSETIYANMGTDMREEVFDYRVLRTDAAINSGNSGGGLFNSESKLVGVVNSKTVSESVENMGYALPAATCKRVISKMLKTSVGSAGWGLDIIAPCFTAVAADVYCTGLNDKGLAEIKEVTVITKVNDFSAVSGKLSVGDILLEVAVKRNGVTVDSVTVNREHNVTDVLISAEVGDVVWFTVEHEGQIRIVKVAYPAGYTIHKD